MKLTTHVRLVRRIRMSGAAPLFPLYVITLLLYFLIYTFDGYRFMSGDNVKLVENFPTFRRNVLFLYSD